MWASGVKAVAASSIFDSKVRIRLSSDQVIPNTTWTQIAWATADYDTLSEFDAGNNRIIVAVSGYYSIKWALQSSQMGVDKACQNRLKVNGAVVSGCAGLQGDATYGYTKFCGSTDIQLTAGDLITMDLHHSYGANRSLIHAVEGGCTLSYKRFT